MKLPLGLSGSLSISAFALQAACLLAAGCAGGSAPASAGYGGRNAGYPGGAYPQSEPGAPQPSSQSKEAAGDAVAEERPGLGTQWGEQRDSSITSVGFQRGDAANPFATSVVYYNDEEGARSMATASGFARTTGGLYPLANGALRIGLKDESGAWLNGFSANSKNYVVGEAGHRYSIVVRNSTQFKIECVLSVDGLDVLDGKDASFSKRGYIVDPRGEIEVDGFRTSTTQVAAFRFGSVRGSYAGQKYGDTTNVGVIGLAVFHERGTEPWKWNEVEKRHDANPFPGQFAQPPGVAK
jgi:hypothetical protein